MRFKFLLPILLLTGCATQPHVETRIKTVYCLTPEQYKDVVKADPGKIGSQLTGQAQQDFKIVAEQSVLVRHYIDGVMEILGGCVG